MDASALDSRARRRATSWLTRHGLATLSPTPLLARRLAVRRRARIALLAVLGVAALLMLATVGWVHTPEDVSRRAVPRLVGMIALVVFAVLLRLSLHRAVRAGDRRIGAKLTRRVAHPIPPGWRTLLGRRSLAIAAMLYTLTIGLGAAAALVARTTQDRTLVAVLVVGVLALAGATAAEIADAVRRPALADDSASLVIDDALRADDARTAATSQMPVLLAVLTAMALSHEAAFRLTTACFAAIVITFLAGVWEQQAVGSSRPRRAADRPATLP